MFTCLVGDLLAIIVFEEKKQRIVISVCLHFRNIDYAFVKLCDSMTCQSADISHVSCLFGAVDNVFEKKR